MRRKLPAVFLDRDGTILNERGYLSDPRRIYFYPSAIPGLQRLSRAGFPLVVITNQSGVARGYLTLERFHVINNRFKNLLKARGVRLRGVYFCPHAPDAGCSCRKPKPLLALKAAREWGLDLKKSFMVGDQVRDMQLAAKIGATGVLVLTGAGLSSRKKAAPWTAKRAKNLMSAANWIIKKAKQHEK